MLILVSSTYILTYLPVLVHYILWKLQRMEKTISVRWWDVDSSKLLQNIVHCRICDQFLPLHCVWEGIQEAADFHAMWTEEVHQNGNVSCGDDNSCKRDVNDNVNDVRLLLWKEKAICKIQNLFNVRNPFTCKSAKTAFISLKVVYCLIKAKCNV